MSERRLKWKVCGLRDNVEEVAALRPDYAGFIFYPKSPRFVGRDFVIPVLDEKIKKVAVVVNATMHEIMTIFHEYNFDYVQLHGEEDEAFCKKLKEKGLKLIKAFQVDASFDFDKLAGYGKWVDFFLFDTRTAAYGGSGRAFDWEILNDYPWEKEYFLSGGIGLGNIGDLKRINMSKIHAIDVNSRFERSPGLKDVEKLKYLKDSLNKINHWPSGLGGR